MAEQSNRDILLHDPLSEVTRKERRMLLAVSMLGIGLVKTGLVPTKIEALGVEFDKTNQQALLVIVAVITFYFFLAFVIYAAADFLAWRKALRSYEIERYREHLRRKHETPKERLDEEQSFIQGHFSPYGASRMIYSLSAPVAVLRATFEFVLPLVVGTYAIQLLWFSGARI